MMNRSSEESTVVHSHFEGDQASVEVKRTLLWRLLHFAKTLVQFVRLLVNLLLDDRVDRKVKIFVGAVLTYVFAPVDFIPEIFSGLFGMLDDFVLSAFALNVILNWVDPEVVRSHWRGSADLLTTIQKGINNAEVLVPEAILKKIETWIGRHAPRALVPIRPATVQQSERPRRKGSRKKQAD